MVNAASWGHTTKGHTNWELKIGSFTLYSSSRGHRKLAALMSIYLKAFKVKVGKMPANMSIFHASGIYR